MQVYPNSPGFKTPGTSEEAARVIAPKAAILREKLYTAFQRYGAMTADEACEVSGVSILAGRPRVSEMVRLGILMDTGTRRPSSTGKTSAVWAIAPEKVAA